MKKTAITLKLAVGCYLYDAKYLIPSVQAMKQMHEQHVLYVAGTASLAFPIKKKSLIAVLDKLMEECNLGHHFNDEKDCLCWVTDDFAPSSNRKNSIRMRVCVPMEFTARGALRITDNIFELMELLLVKNFADMTALYT